MEKLEEYKAVLVGKTPAQVIEWAEKEFTGSKVALASSLGPEDQVLTQMLNAHAPSTRIFTLDTGRLFQETYDVMQHTIDAYGVRYEVCTPDNQKVANMVSKKGPNLFRNSIEDRKLCCNIRKVEPLKKVLGTLKAWVTGLRQEQSVTRTGVHVIEWDQNNAIYKINPLWDWSEAKVWDFIDEYGIPYTSLHDKGFRSIGCAPCTRATNPGEDARAGRWWWETPEQKECGLHMVNGKLERIKK